MVQPLGKNTLIVDDELTIRNLLKEFLEVQGFHVHTAENAEEVLVILNEKDFALILTDYEMPRMKGDKLVRLIKEKYPYMKDRFSINFTWFKMSPFPTPLRLYKYPYCH